LDELAANLGWIRQAFACDHRTLSVDFIMPGSVEKNRERSKTISGTDEPGRLDLLNFERQQARFLFGFTF
jgi:hypothetical protein